MAKNVCVNKEMINEEVVFLTGRLRNAIAFNGRNRVPVYLAGVHKEAIDAIKAMGVKVDEKKGRWTIELFAPKKGSKAWNALFNGSKVLDDAKTIKVEKEKAAAAAAKEKAAAKAAKERLRLKRRRLLQRLLRKMRKPRLKRLRLKRRRLLQRQKSPRKPLQARLRLRQKLRSPRPRRNPRLKR